MRRRLVILALAFVVAAGAGAALGAAAGGGGIAELLFGPRMMRAEVVMNDGTDYLADRGRIAAVTAAGLTLREADSRVVQIPLSSSTRVTIGGTVGSANFLRRGLVAVVLRPANGAALLVQVTRP